MTYFWSVINGRRLHYGRPIADIDGLLCCVVGPFGSGNSIHSNMQCKFGDVVSWILQISRAM
jgi:hypothetical protein